LSKNQDENECWIFFSEHTSTKSSDKNFVSSGVIQIKSGAWLVSVGSVPTNFFIRGVFPTMEEAISEYRKFSMPALAAK